MLEKWENSWILFQPQSSSSFCSYDRHRARGSTGTTINVFWDHVANSVWTHLYYQTIEMSCSRKQMAFMSQAHDFYQSAFNAPLEHQCSLDIFNDTLQFVQLQSYAAVVSETSVFLLRHVLWTSSVSVHVGCNEPRPFVFFLLMLWKINGSTGNSKSLFFHPSLLVEFWICWLSDLTLLWWSFGSV